VTAGRGSARRPRASPGRRLTGGTGLARRVTSGTSSLGWRLTSRPEPPERRSWLPALTVQGWFRVVFAALAVLVAAAVIIIVQLVAHGRAVTRDLTEGILPAQAQAYRLQGALVNQETGVRGYGITGDRNFLRPYTSGLATEANAAAQLRSLIGAQKPLVADLRQIEHAAAGWRASYAAPMIELAASGPLTGHDFALVNKSKRAFDHLRALFNVQNGHLSAAAREDSSRISRFSGVQDLTYALILVVFVVASAVLALILQRAVGRPLRRLGAASRRVTGGDFGHQIEPSGPSDIWAVAADVESMRRELAAAVDHARASAEVAIEQAAELDAAAADLRRSNAELEQFAYVASHDLQEPLRKVASFCQLLERRYGDQLDERGRQYIDFAVDGARRLQVLINDLLTFSRVGSTGDVQAMVPMDRTLDSAMSALGTVIEESGAVIGRPERLPEVTGDPTLLAMVWQNLISNAIKFRAAGRPPRVDITAEPDAGGHWRFCVADNGIGIQPEFADTVFVIFQRLHGRDAYPGTGIGLALCKRIIEHHGGEISLDTSYLAGARVCFTLAGGRAAGPDGAALRSGRRARPSTEEVPA
jgi:signal transduction histidine kinase